MLKISQITDESWLVESPTKEGDIKLLSKNKDDFVLIGNGVKVTFHSMNEVSEYFNEDIFKNIKDNSITQTDLQFFIRGYLVDCEEPLEVFAPTNGMPLFKKNKYSDIEYAAGYYAVKRGRWSYLLCPKLSTLQEYPYEGPFQTKDEAVKYVRKLRKDGQL